MGKRWIAIPILLTFSVACFVVGTKIGSDYAVYRECRGIFPVLYGLYLSPEISPGAKQTLKVHSWGALSCMEDASSLSLRLYEWNNPVLKVDPDSGSWIPDRGTERPEQDFTEAQLDSLRSLYDNELNPEIPTLEKLRAIAERHSLPLPKSAAVASEHQR